MVDSYVWHRRLHEWMDYLSLGSVSPTALAAGVAGVAVVGTALIYLSRSAQPFRLNYDRECVSKEVTTGDADGIPARISKFCNPGDELHSVAYDECRTLHDCFHRGARVSNNGQCLGWRPSPGAPYKWMTFSEVDAAARDFGAGMMTLGLQHLHGAGDPDAAVLPQQELIGIYSQNNKEWMIAAEGAWSYSMCIVPLYDTLGPNACTLIVNQALIIVVLCDTVDKIRALLDRAKETPTLRHIVLTIPVNAQLMADVAAQAASLHIKIHTFEEILTLGAENPRPIQPPTSDDLAVVCYTSGTTGNPKGALMSHGNYTATLAGLERHMQLLNISPSDVIFSYLPLAHTFEQVATSVMLGFGASIGFFQGDMKLLMDDMETLKPTIFPTVPRLLNRLYDNVTAKARASSIKSRLFDLALRKKMEEVDRGVFRKTSIWDKLVFKKVHATMGGRVRAIFCGSAPLDPSIMQFVRSATGAIVLEGYGQTECGAVTNCQLPGETVPGQVGPPLPCSMVKLVDVPEMEIFARDGKGEVCIKGNNVFKGYLKDEVNTAQTLKDGWLHTGDIGIWAPNGALQIVDRKKHIFKLAQGEYIAPEKIEAIFSQSSFVAQVFLHGESYKSCLIAFAVPHQPEIENWANQHGLDGLSYEALLEDSRVKKAVMEDVNKLGKAAGLKSFELIKEVKLYAEPWTVENGLLTPTFKTKRPQMVLKFQADIQNMYSRLW